MSQEEIIKTLQESLKLKDDQLNTLKDSLTLKDGQVKTLEDSLNLKAEKIDTLEKTLKLKEEQIASQPTSSVDDSLIAEKDKAIDELQKEIEVLSEELSKADEDIEGLEAELEKAKGGSSSGDSSNAKIQDFTNIVITKTEILEKMRSILETALHKVTIAVPSIEDLQDLYLYEVRSSVNLQISCLINPGIELHADLLEEFESLDNISLRTYEGEDRYIIVKDGEELFFAVVGNKEDNHLVFNTKDSKHIQLMNSIVMESWLRSRKI
jgi:chromosome segregation ATPase